MQSTFDLFYILGVVVFSLIFIYIIADCLDKKEYKKSNMFAAVLVLIVIAITLSEVI